MHEFNFHRPASLDEAKQLLGSNDEAKFLGGGQSLIPVLKLGLAMPTDLVSLAAIPELKGIRVQGDTLVVGAAATHAEVHASADVRSMIPALADLAHGIGDAQVRNRGTIGGSVAHADPAADYPAALVALEATIKTDRRTLAATEFFEGMFQTPLAPDEIIVEVHFPKPKRAAYAKFASPASKYAIVGVMVAELANGEVRVAVTGASTQVFRVDAMEKALAANFTPEAVKGIHVPSDDLNTDLDADPEYRAHLVTVMATRAVRSAA